MYAMSNKPEPIEDADPDATEIWNTWLEKHGSKNGKAHRLTLQRQEIIRNAISSYGKESCIKAIIGCKHSEWHMGGNPNGKKYNTIELILRVSKKPMDQAKNEKRIKMFSRLARLEETVADDQR